MFTVDDIPDVDLRDLPLHEGPNRECVRHPLGTIVRYAYPESHGITPSNPVGIAGIVVQEGEGSYEWLDVLWKNESVNSYLGGELEVVDVKGQIPYIGVAV